MDNQTRRRSVSNVYEDMNGGRKENNTDQTTALTVMEMDNQTRQRSVPHIYEDMQLDREENNTDQTMALTAAVGDDMEEYEVLVPPTHNPTVNPDQNGCDFLVTMADQRFERLTTQLCHQKVCVIILIVVSILSTAGLVAYLFYSLEKTENQTEMIHKLKGRIENLTAADHLTHPKDCHSLWEQGFRTSGVYKIWLKPGYGSEVRCDFDKSNGWTIIQRRFDGSVDFYRDWDSYKTGFGDPHTEYWLGNDNIYYLTRTNRKLSIYLQNYMGEEGTANYSTFYINNEGDNYRLTISGYSGSVEDQMAYHNNQEFSTRDRDNDVHSTRHCAVMFTGAWWYRACIFYTANLNGVWTNSSSGSGKNMVWLGSWSGGHSRPLQRCTMRVTRD